MKNNIDIKTISPSALAYLGDSVIEMCVREYLVRCGLSLSSHLNEEALRFVRATAQAEAVKRIIPHLTEDETAAFRRGRNIGHTNTPRSATVGEYRLATGMEALFGWLWLTDSRERIDELFSLAYELDRADNIEKLKKGI